MCYEPINAVDPIEIGPWSQLYSSKLCNNDGDEVSPNTVPGQSDWQLKTAHKGKGEWYKTVSSKDECKALCNGVLLSWGCSFVSITNNGQTCYVHKTCSV